MMGAAEFARRHAGKRMDFAGDYLVPRQDVIVCGFSKGANSRIGICVVLTADNGYGWKSDNTIMSKDVDWVIPSDGSLKYRFVDQNFLTPREVLYPNFPHKCRACGEPAYVGAYEVDCVSPSCIYYKGTTS